MNCLFEELLKKRGFDEGFLNPRYEKLPSPWLMPDMEKAVERITQAIHEEETLIIYGDYDADGVTASVVMNDALILAGAKKIDIMLPNRFDDGYGMSQKVVQRAKEIGAKLVITVDCGSGNLEIVDRLKSEGVDTIVTDHHECSTELPNAVAIVNPKRKDLDRCVKDFDKHVDELMELRELAGVGVAFMVARGMSKKGLIPKGQEKWLLDLVLIGTICDSMKINMINRILCFYGTKVLGKTRRVGLKELIRVSGMNRITSETIGFQIGPRINAAGRMTDANTALDLLLTTNKAEGARLAEELNRLNAERRDKQIVAMKELSYKPLKDQVLVEVGDWHEGILGIIAGKLVEKYNRPAFVFTETEEGVLKGSGRSFGDFSLANALKVCNDVIIGGGGHAGAAGVKVQGEMLDDFRRKMNEYYASLGLIDQERFLKIASDVETADLADFTLELMEDLRSLEPFGVGNELPVFGLRGMMILDKKMMGAEGKHLRLIVRGEDGKTMKLIAFNAPDEWRNFEVGEFADALIHIEENDWNGLRSIEGRILDLKGC